MKEKVWFGMKVTPAQKADIKRLAQKRGQSATATVLDLVQRALEEEEIVAEPGSFLAALEAAGLTPVDDNLPADLSTNPTYMEGYGQ
ncbi:MAG: hypothetical protein IH820_13960 [Bacteroidetes bacterium]|nr:hypothetical protein [Bacteroidota bacterium]